MLYTISFSIPGLEPVDAEGKTLFSCLARFFDELHSRGDEQDAAQEVQEDILKAVAVLTLRIPENADNAVYQMDLDGGVMSLQKRPL